VALAKGRRASLLLVLPGAAWALAIVTVLADPVHAFYFWLD
jgi:hypothetical protein